MTSNGSGFVPENEGPAEVAPLGEVLLVDVGEVYPAPRNPRKIPDRAIEVVAGSLKKFGWQQPLVVDKAGVLVVGHTRLLAARSLGLKQVPVVAAENLTEREIEAYRIADNRTHDFTTWDLPELVIQLDDLAADFSDVLALEDWQSIVAEFDDLALDVSDDAKVDMSGGGFEIVIAFKDKASALAVEQQLLDLPGAMDVRHRRA